ncbi:Spy/CpxP family protein refolding chaperone [Sulfurovum sp. NBC37-1]|uniref:Spy/CpxP family protein refolding chaperone n=1 Tax=Sulfurovum sp. (strain NBC37-1) TaxID=387093 RepID=UPI0001587950|nr:Spy/CpxP family protein refolding chaperone [Sulfurovum sp. NBC37-1]BAF72371.1 conserved hypothetical protein [Sulfurovum sp. NBC37-1]
MKKNRFIATLAALGMVTAVYAGNGMDCGGCKHQGYGEEMQQQNVNVMIYTGNNCGKQGHNRMGSGAKSNMHGRGMKHNGMMKQIISQLNLSDAQKQKIREIKRESRQAMKQKHMKPKMDFTQFMNKDHFDKEAFQKTMEQKWETKDKVRQEKREAKLVMMSDRMARIFEVLTPEQREKLIELKK